MRIVRFNLVGGILILPCVLLLSDSTICMFLGVAYFALLVFATHKVRFLRVFFRSWLNEIEQYEKKLFR